MLQFNNVKFYQYITNVYFLFIYILILMHILAFIRTNYK